jgi:hypothetical protein
MAKEIFMRYNELFEASRLKDKLNAVEETADQELDEARWRSGGWVIRPATMDLYGRRTVDIKTAISEWGDGTIYVCSKEENGKSRILFVASSGDIGAKVGEVHEAIHDGTGASKGFYRVENIVHFDDNEIVSKVNDIGLNMKASVAVFK